MSAKMQGDVNIYSEKFQREAAKTGPSICQKVMWFQDSFNAAISEKMAHLEINTLSEAVLCATRIQLSVATIKNRSCDFQKNRDRILTDDIKDILH
jgi:hypothetical protein